jgi:glycosyltransferase involved in cell wall biosynthesis
MTARSLSVQLEAPLPREVAVGAGSAVFAYGSCHCPGARVEGLEFEVRGERTAVMWHGMPRADGETYRSGFWGLIPLSGEGDAEVELHAQLEDGGEASAVLGTIALRARVAAPEPPASTARVAICMATHNPPQELLERQLDSIRAQTHTDWVCVISDDHSSEERFAGLRQAVGDDPRFVVSRATRRLGFYHNFERALAMAPPTAELVALCDQDDRWHPGKLATLVDAIGDAQLVYSDARIVDRDGALISETYWTTRENNHSDMTSLLIANAVTGAASLLRRDLLERALPFPPGQFSHYHDHWLGLCARAAGEIRFVDEPLYDYVQHGEAFLGHAPVQHMHGIGSRVRRIGRDPRDRVRRWRMHYFVDLCRLYQFATVLLERFPETTSRRQLERFLRSDRSLAGPAMLAARGARELVARRPQTLGAEWMLFCALVWRRLLRATAGRPPDARLRLDALPPPTLAQGPARGGLAAPQLRSIAEKIAPLELTVAADAPRRVNLLIPSIDLDHFFGGYIGKLNLARRLAERGLQVRLVTVDHSDGPPPRRWRSKLEEFSGLQGVFDHVEVALGREQAPIEVSPQDGFIATTWWTAHIAQRALQLLGRERFLYLIQEYEPFTFAMGSHAALAAESYTFPHHALFSTDLLREYFERHELGVYRHGGEALSFENAITAVSPPGAAELAARRTRRLLVYARPEPHAARNMFELAMLGLGRAFDEGAFRRDWSLAGIGSVGETRELELGPGATVRLLPRATEDEYAQLLREHDLGLALMYTPHPSLVPIEMAAAGMLVVTNTFENKTAARLSAISPNLIAAEPTIAGVATALRSAAEQIGDVERRVAGARVNWSRDWAQSLPDELLDRVSALL